VAYPKVRTRLYGLRVYLLVELCLLLRPVARHLNETLGFSLGEGVPNYIRRLAAQDYRDTYERIKQSIVRSYVAYADETNAELRDGTKGMLVVATDQEVVTSSPRAVSATG